MKIISVVGARPNFMKIAPFMAAVAKHNSDHGTDKQIDHYLVHTGQHYDLRMSESFFDALSIPQPDIDLGIGSGSHAEQVGQTMIEFEKVLNQLKPDWVVVVGDVNATCACSITAKKEQVLLAHIEAGLRSFDLAMPEEINRMVTDRLSDMLFTTDAIASNNLRYEGVAEDKIKLVGNVMIDTLDKNKDVASKLQLEKVIVENALNDKEVEKFDRMTFEEYALMTMHRPSNVDTKVILEPLVKFILNEVTVELPVVWPLHPRTRKQLELFDLWEDVKACENIILLHPLGYHEFMRLNISAKLMFTDSGGLQEECCVLGTPCLTLRWNTERPITLQEHGGVSVLVGNNVDRLRDEYAKMKNSTRNSFRPPMWDGKAAERVVYELLKMETNS